jgi:ATPase family AAA domain-containing protein 3A/B
VEAAERAKAAVGLFFASLGSGIMAILNSPLELLKLIGIFILLLMGWFTSREGSILLRHVLARRFGRPALVRETSRKSGIQALTSFFFAIFFGIFERIRWLLTGCDLIYLFSS